MPLSDAERQKRARQRRKQERAANLRRAEVRQILEAGAACACCGESWIEFLTLGPADEVLCHNCASVRERGLLCVHRGIRRTLG